MRRGLIGGCAAALMVTALTGCQSWWVENVRAPVTSTYGRSTCTISVPANQSSGWVVEKLSNAQQATNPDENNPQWVTQTQYWMDGDVAWINNIQPVHYPGSDVRLWQNGASQGAKTIVGIYPGETYEMGFHSEVYMSRGDLKSHVVNGSGAVLSTDSNCTLINE